MMFLFIIAVQVFASNFITLGSSQPLASAPVILTSSSASSIIYSCFYNNDEADRRHPKESCCEGVVKVWERIDNENSEDGQISISIAIHQRCMLEMAQVPSTLSYATKESENPNERSKFSWFISDTSSKSQVESTLIEQYLWTASGDDLDQLERKSVKTISPYHKTQSPIQSTLLSTDIIPSKSDSYLGMDGGMHRLFHHSFQSLGSTNSDAHTYFLYLTVPNGMFIDLDDPIEPTTDTIQSTPTEDADDFASNTSHNFVAILTKTQTRNSKSSLLSFRARLHAATVCDIEQPSFVSGQHLLIWEIDKILTANNTLPPVVEFASKLHLRYPHPSSTMDEWIDLPKPLLFVALNSESETLHVKQEEDWGLEVAERVWVATGKGEDHDWIMGMTIFFSLIGVAIMLRDISSVSLWDDV